ncbi:MAG: DUF1573 domain-containing protein [Crocinitomicaceae bacterium]
MKKVLVFGLLIALTACSSEKVEDNFGKPTTMDVKTMFDFGQVKQGEIVKAKFEITNTGDLPLNIVRVEPSCGCTVADFTKEPILPGKKGWVSAQVNTDRFEGEIRKSLNVMANTSPTATTFIIKGVVIK